VLRHWSSTDALGTCSPSRINGIRPAAGTCPIRMLHPCQPARRAFGPSGLRGSMIALVKKWRGTTIRSVTRVRPLS
jgi:hypothetical protein